MTDETHTLDMPAADTQPDVSAIGWLDDAETIDQETLDLAGPSYPWIQWVHGDPAFSNVGGVPYSGGWFCPEANMPPGEAPAWERGALAHNDGTSTRGWYAAAITLCPIRMRRCWRLRTDGGYQRFPGSSTSRRRRWADPPASCKCSA